MDNTIKLILDDSGQIKDARLNFRLYQGAVGAVGIEIYVPRNMLNAPLVANDDTVISSNSVTIYSVATSQTGKTVTSAAEQCVFLRKENKDGIEYWVFTRVSGLPKEFLMYAGELKICASIFKLYKDDQDNLKLQSRSKMQMFRVQVLENPDGDLAPEYDADEMTALYETLNAILESQSDIYGADGQAGTTKNTPAVNLTTLNQNKAERLETVLKYDIGKELPPYISYTKAGYKTAGILFMNETFTVPTDVAPAINLETVKGALLVANLYKDIENPTTIAWQNEIFYHEKGNCTRKIKLDISQFEQDGTITAIEVGDWKVQNYAWFDTTSQQIISLGNRVSALEADYVSKALNILPLEEKEEFAVTETGAFTQTTTKRDIRTGEKTTTTVTPIPVVEGKARLFLPQEIQALRQLLHWQETLSGEALNYIVDLSDMPVGYPVASETMQNYLNAKYQTVTATPDTILDQVTLHDEVLGMAFRWYENTEEWVQSQGSLAAKATNNVYTNGTLSEQGNVGGIVGSNKEGYIFLEANGEAALNGYDALKQRGLNNQQAIADEVANRQAAITAEAAARAAEDAAINAIIGVLANLSTSDKTTLVAAINSLKTESNTNAAAISALADRVSALETNTVKITGNQQIDGEKNFIGSFKINGAGITYDGQTDTFSL